MRLTRPALALLALLAEAVPLASEATHGGIAVHHPMQRADLPGLGRRAWPLTRRHA